MCVNNLSKVALDSVLVLQLFRRDINTPIFIFCCCRSFVKLLYYLRAEKISIQPVEAPLRPEARGICHICHVVNPALSMGHANIGKLIK